MSEDAKPKTRRVWDKAKVEETTMTLRKSRIWPLLKITLRIMVS